MNHAPKINGDGVYVGLPPVRFEDLFVLDKFRFKGESEILVKRDEQTAYVLKTTNENDPLPPSMKGLSIAMVDRDSVVGPIQTSAIVSDPDFQPATVTTPAKVLTEMCDGPPSKVFQAFHDYIKAESDLKTATNRRDLAIATLRASLIKAGLLDLFRAALS